MKKSSKIRGYSLIEIVLYVSIVAVMAVIVVGSVLSVYRAFLKTRVDRSITLNGDVAMESMIRGIREAESVTVAGSVFGSNPGILQMNNKTFSVSSEILRVEEGANPAIDLTSDARVTNLVFYRAAGALSDLITLEMTLEAGGGVFKKSKKFYGSAVLRGMY